MTIRVVLADDQAVVRDGLRLLLSAADDIEVVAAARDGAEAVQLVAAHEPDVALFDLRMPGLDGAQATARLAAEVPGVPVLILTTFLDDDAVLPALRAGAVGYLTKDVSGEELVAAIRDVAAGRTVLDTGVARRLVELVRSGVPPAGPPEPGPPEPGPPEAGRPEAGPQPLAGLTKREIDVVRLVAEGLSNRQIARRLVLSEATVKTHLNHVLSKVDVADRSGLVAWAWRHGLGGA